MYGAMDGAMKFVKGDSIAGLIVTAINILGGVLIGVTHNPLALFDIFRYRVRPSRPTWILGRDKLCDGIPSLDTLQEAIDRSLAVCA